MLDTKRTKILKLAHSAGVLRPRDLERAGISGEYLNRLHSEGLLSRPSRGLYVLAEREVGEHQSLVEACKRVPHGVVCLLSALQFHGLTTQSPFEVWLAIGEKARLPKVDSPALRVVRFGKASLAFGVKSHKIGRVAVPSRHLPRRWWTVSSIETRSVWTWLSKRCATVCGSGSPRWMRFGKPLESAG